MISTIIVDDERLAREGLKSLLLKIPDIQIVAEAENVDEALDLIEKLKPQLVFLDIQMPEKSGFDLLEELIETPAIIFTTAYDEYALKAFEVNALDYLLKPIEQDRLNDAISKIKKQIEDLKVDRLRSKLLPHEKVFLRDGDKCWYISLNEIRLIESAGNYAKIHFDKFQPLIHRTLNSLDERLSDDTFFRANRQQIINLNFLDK
jgi:two-component system LytT family response regulator